MFFTNPSYLLYLILILPIILLFLKKNQKIRKEISSSIFWEEVQKEVTGIKKNNINKQVSLLLQILIIILLTLILANPLIVDASKKDNLSILIDNSVSMNYGVDKVPKIEMAKDEAVKIVKAMYESQAISIFTVNTSREALGENLSKGEAVRILQTIKATELPLDFSVLSSEGAFDNEIFITDKELEIDNQLLVEGRSDNLKVKDVYIDYADNKIKSLIETKGLEGKYLEAGIYSGDKRVDIKRKKIEMAMEKIIFEIPKEDNLSIRIENNDDFPGDNIYYLPVGDQFETKVYLNTQNPLFANVLGVIPDVSLVDDFEHSDLIITEREVPEYEKVQFVLAPKEELIVGEVTSSSKVTYFIKEKMREKIQDLNLEDASLLDGEGKNILMKTEEGNLIVAEDDYNKVYFSDCFAKAENCYRQEYPLIVKILIDKLKENDKRTYYTGEKFDGLNGEYLEDINSSRQEGVLDQSGIYKRIFDSGYQGMVAVNVNPESLINYQGDDLENSSIKFDHKSLDKILIMIVMVFIALEWEVSRRGY